MTNDDKDLKPCKICNKKHNEMQEYGIGPCDPSTWFVRVCLNCGWQSEAGKNEEKANEAWNTRTTPQQPQRQDSLTDQMETVKTLARNAGCYDALDWLNNNFGKTQQPSEPLKELDEKGLSDLWFSLPYGNINSKIAGFIKAICSKFGQPSEKKSKAEAIYEAIKKSDVGDDIVIHNEDMSVWCILNLVTREHPERETNGKDRS